MNGFKLTCGLIFSLSVLSFSVSAQKKNEPTPAAPAPAAPAAPPASGNKSGPKPYKDVITDKSKSQKGLFSVHKVEDKYYFEIPDSVLGREIMAITRFSKMAGGASIYGGEMANQQVLKFEKGPENKVFMRVVSVINVANDSTQPIYTAVRNSNLDPIAASFEIKAFSKDSNGVVIDISDFFKGDNQPVSINPIYKRAFNLGGLAGDRSYIESIRTYPINTEIRTVKTFNASPAMPGSGPGMPSISLRAANAAGAVTIETNTSLLLLPAKPSPKRKYDQRIGFFADEFSVYDDNQQKVEENRFIVRWKLEPKPEDVEKWKAGELVEPIKPIIYYIDPATPKKWRKHLIAGVNDWQKAFEKAGFKNAIMGKEWPENDSTMSLEDARFSVIRYFASPIQNAYGPNAHDPRSGEILESHIGWYHNVMDLLHDWYFVQASTSDTAARKMTFDDDLMGDLIRFVSSHEVGHTIGLRHNMGSSSKTPVEKLRDKAWVESNGHTASIMDYARFNYVAQPEDKISRVGLYPRIGDYDLWAIEWGYGYAPGKDEEEQQKYLSKKYNERLAKNPRIWFGSYEFGNFADPRTQSEDLGDNAMKASEFGIKNLKLIMSNLQTWTKEEADDYSNLNKMYGQVVSQFQRYAGHVMRNIGGYYETAKTVEQQGDIYEAVPKPLQKDAVSFLQKQLFTTPAWMLDKNILNKISNPSGDYVGNMQDQILASLLSSSRLGRMTTISNRYENAYSVDEYFSDLEKGLFGELQSRIKIDGYRRNIQKSYVERIIGLINSNTGASATITGMGISYGPDMRKSDVSSIAKAHLVDLRNIINNASQAYTDKLSKYHLQDLADRIKQALNPVGK